MSKAKKAARVKVKAKAKAKVKKLVKASGKVAELGAAVDAAFASTPVAATATPVAAVAKEHKDSKGKDLLVRFIADRMNVSIVFAREMFDNVIAVIEEGIIMLGKVTITGFGTFTAKEVAARAGRNPMTGETINIPKSVRLSFKAGKSTKAKLIAAAGGTLAQKERAVSSQDDVKRAKAAVKKALVKRRR